MFSWMSVSVCFEGVVTVACCLQVYMKQKDDPPIARDMPIVSGRIAWARQLYRVISEPMHTFSVSESVNRNEGNQSGQY